jgi:putative membrane protein
MTRTAALTFAAILLAALWLGPLPSLARASFTAHMTLHVGVIACAAPLLAFGLAGTARDPARAHPLLFAALPAAALELVIVWAWHAPVLHHAARGSTTGLMLEQASFLAAGWFVWMSALGGDPHDPGNRAGLGVVALLLTSMHMTLLGAVLSLGPRPLYHGGQELASAAALGDQHLGGAIMLMAGAAVYLIGGLLLAARVLLFRPHGRPA